MKTIGVVTLVLFVAALLSYGPGVPTQNTSAGYSIDPTTFTGENKGTITPSTTLNSIRLNPPHGQPGHRCDIRVGQPLDSKPTTPASKLIIPAASIIPITPADGLNPKHGQPGHRCDIAVGQPLNSKPPAQTSAAAPAQTSNSVTPAINIPASSSASTPPLLNPKHGQPYHRCDIMVGQPLNSKPTVPAITKTSANTTNAPAITPLRSAANATPLLNPKHGQPGHRCDILVGQPLNGKPPFTLPAK